MNKFLLKVLNIIIAFIGIAICYSIYVNHKLKEIHTLREDAIILLIGDSHLAKNIDDNLFPIFENRASSAEVYNVCYYKLRNIVNQESNNNRIKAICLSYNFFSFSSYMDHIYVQEEKSRWINDYSPLFMNIFDMPSKYGMSLDENEFSLCAQAWLQAITPTQMRALAEGKLVNRFNEYKGQYQFFTDSMSEEELEKNSVANIKGYYYSDINQWDIKNKVSLVQQNNLRLIASFAKDNNIPLFLVNAPQYKKCNEMIPADLKILMSDFAKELNAEYGTVYLDYHNYVMPDSCFLDSSHLNASGASVFAPILFDDVKSELKKLECL